MTTSVEASVPLALFDYVPVLLTASGAWLLGERVERRSVCRLAAVGLLAGGGMKATWKLMLAVQDRDYGLLFHGLFPFLATGFALLGIAVAAEVGLRAEPWFGVVLLSLSASLILRSDRPLLIATAAGTALVGLSLVAVASRRRATPAAGAALLWMVASSSLAPLAAHVQTTGLAWLEQSLNSVAQGCLLLAVVLLPAAPALLRTPDKELVA